MQRRPDSRHILEAMMGELARPRGRALGDAEDYPSIEVLREPAPANELRRDPTEDFMTTMKFVREAADADPGTTLPFARYSAPYELIDLQHTDEQVPAAKPSRRFAAVRRATGSNATNPLARSREAHECDTLRFPRYSEPYERIELQQASTNEPPAARTPRAIRASENLVAGDAVRTSGSFEAAWFARADDALACIEAPTPSLSSRPVIAITLLVGALALGVALAFLVI